MKNTNLLILLIYWSCNLPAQVSEGSFFLEHAKDIIEEETIFTVKNNRQAVKEIRRRVTVLSESSDNNVYAVYYDPDNKILDMDATIYDLLGREIRKVKNSEIRDYAAVDGFSVYQDDRLKVIEVNTSSYPYIVEFTSKQNISGMALVSPKWYAQQHSSSAIRKSTFKLIIPAEIKANYRSYNMEEEPTVTGDASEVVYYWEVRDVPAYEQEPLQPSFRRSASQVHINLSPIKVEEYTSIMTDWKSYGYFKNQLYEGRDILPESIKQEVLTLTADATSNQEKVDRIYRYLQENVRYVSVQLGIGGWQPFDAEYVAENQYGDCKALSNYTKAMLNVVGIESYPTFIFSDKDKPYTIEDDFVSPVFNHVILYIPEEDCWLECTSSNKPSNYLGRHGNNRRVAMATPDGGVLKDTPNLGEQDNIDQEIVEVMLSADGSAILEYEGTFLDLRQDRWRDISYYFSAEEIEEEIREKGQLPTSTLSEISLVASSQLPEVNLHFNAAINRYAAKGGKRLFVPLNVICPLQNIPEEVEDRHFPVAIPYGYLQQMNLTIDLPKGYSVESLPDSLVEITTDFGSYSLEVIQTENQVIISREFVQYGEELPAEQYEGYREFLIAVAKKDGAKMVLVED